MSEPRKHRSFTPEQNIKIVLAGLCGDRPVRDVCRAYEISEAALFDQHDRRESRLIFPSFEAGVGARLGP